MIPPEEYAVRFPRLLAEMVPNTKVRVSLSGLAEEACTVASERSGDQNRIGLVLTAQKIQRCVNLRHATPAGTKIAMIGRGKFSPAQLDDIIALAEEESRAGAEVEVGATAALMMTQMLALSSTKGNSGLTEMTTTALSLYSLFVSLAGTEIVKFDARRLSPFQIQKSSVAFLHTYCQLT